MKHGLWHGHMARQPVHTSGHHPVIGPHRDEHRLALPVLLAIIATCILTFLIVVLLSMVQVYFTTGVWPLFG